AAPADAIVALDRGRVVPSLPFPSPDGAARPARPRRRPPVFELRGVGHVYGAGSPWAHRALADIDLTVGAGESLLLVGKNGSGKSTLAWILAGLRAPSDGLALLDGQPVVDQVGRVALA